MHYVRALLTWLFRRRPGVCGCGAPGLCSYDDGRLLCARCAMVAEHERYPAP